jgi:uncharacterized protein (TIGR03382 family)
VLYTVTFDFYCIDSWDGDNILHGTDHFRVSANGQVILDETFANQDGATQSFRAPDVGPVELGFNTNFRDSIYRRISRDFTVPMGEQIRLTWADGGLQGMNDESWGIDNVDVTYRVVPAPGVAGVALAGLSLLGRRRR